MAESAFDWDKEKNVSTERFVGTEKPEPVQVPEPVQEVTAGPLGAKETIMAEAERLIFGNRQEDYGHPLDNFTQTGRLWAAILNLEEVTPEQVALCMVCVKLSRQTNRPLRDNLVDSIGYLGTIERIEKEKAVRGL